VVNFENCVPSTGLATSEHSIFFKVQFFFQSIVFFSERPNVCYKVVFAPAHSDSSNSGLKASSGVQPPLQRTAVLEELISPTRAHWLLTSTVPVFRVRCFNWLTQTSGSFRATCIFHEHSESIKHSVSFRPRNTIVACSK
jgi:hypothetical protein